DELHGDVRALAPHAALVALADVLVLDARLGPRLLDQARPTARVGLAHQLQGHRPLEARVEGAVDAAHRALAERLDDLGAVPLADVEEKDGGVAEALVGGEGLLDARQPDGRRRLLRRILPTPPHASMLAERAYEAHHALGEPRASSRMRRAPGVRASRSPRAAARA